ncbi:TetR family transcriptional regulator [Tsukamurella sp. NPDC003166]|uniref:TetR/AcrR family transcriptional regulator n=1 Tax=Tsukamurella sp. NPDC003166 TaxID=3154444 RepID=UPI0033BF9F5C
MASGRRAGTSTAKADILEAARVRFGESGYDRTTIRAIAADAGVDVALVSYYFGNKAGLFREVMSLPIDPTAVFGAAFEGPRAQLGERLVRAGLSIWEGEETAAAVQAVLRAAVSVEDGRSSIFGEFVAHEILPLLTQKAQVSIEVGRVVASTLFGLAFMRYLVASPIYTAPSREELARSYGGAIQRIIDAEAS